MNALHVTDTRIASSLLGLGFAGEIHATTHTQSGQTQVEVRFLTPSERFPHLDPVMIVRHWKTNRFLQPFEFGKALIPAEPMHMLAVMMRAQESYDAFLKLLHDGGGMHLEPVVFKKEETDQGQIIAYKYHPGENITALPRVIPEPLEDLSLAAALGPLGISIVHLHGSTGEHRCYMALSGKPITDTAGQIVEYHTADLIRFAEHGERRLALEDVNPHHPLVIGYDALYARQCLKKEINRANANLLITANDNTAKQALIALNFKGHVGAAVCRHMKAPPGALGLS